jgi:FlgD Ig-like domain
MSRRRSIPLSSNHRAAQDRQFTRRSVASILLLLVSAAVVPMAAGASSAVLVAYGTVYNHERLTLWPDPDTLRIENLRTDLAAIAIIGELGEGEYAGALVDLGGGAAAIAGDTIRFALARTAGMVLDSLHVVTAAEAEEGMALVDLIVASASSGTADPPVATEPALRIFPNPSRGGRVTFVVRSTGTTGSRAGRSETEVAILDPGGRVVCTRAGDRATAGVEIVHWDGRTSDGHRAAQGIYFVRVRSGDLRLAGRLVLLP